MFGHRICYVHSLVFLLNQVEVDEDPAEAKKEGADDNVEVSHYFFS